MSGDHEERDKLSWSEIDKRKDRSSYGRNESRGDNNYSSNYKDQNSISKYKAALEGLFSPHKKKTTPRQENEHVKKLRETSDRQEFQTLANEYIKENGLPDTWDDLECFLRHKDAEILAETIRRLEKLLPEQSETRVGNFKKDLHLISMTTRDRDLRVQVNQLLRNLGETVA